MQCNDVVQRNPGTLRKKPGIPAGCIQATVAGVSFSKSTCGAWELFRGAETRSFDQKGEILVFAREAGNRATLILQPCLQVFAKIACASNDRKSSLIRPASSVDQNEWNEDVVAALAAKEGIDALSEEQMDLVRFARDYFLKHRAFPMVNTVCRINSRRITV